MRTLFQSDSLTIFQSAIFYTTTTVLHSTSSVVIVDPNWLPDEVQAIRRHVERIGRGKKWYLLFTHSDYDHLLGHGAFPEARVIATQALAHNPRCNHILEQIRQWDADNYVRRPWPVTWPQVDLVVISDAQHLLLDDELSLRCWLTPGHNEDGMMVLAEKQRTLITGDYLSDVEFPFVDHDYARYEDTLKKMELVLKVTPVSVLVPGHGHPAYRQDDMAARLRQSWQYLDAVWAHVTGRKHFDEAWLWARYPFQAGQATQHLANIRRAEATFERTGGWRAQPH